MMNFLKGKRLAGIIILFMCAFILVGCGTSENRQLWNNYVDAVNNQDLDALALNFSDPEFKNTHSDYFTKVSKIETLSYEETIACDFSNETNSQAYYAANIKANVTINNNEKEIEFVCYSYLDNKGLYLCSDFDFESTTPGNKPTVYWTEKVYHTTPEYIYQVKNIGKEDEKVVYVQCNLNAKDIVIPNQIEGKSVKDIGEYAFYKYSKVLCFTVPTSKLTNLTISEGIETISKFAFYQCKKLKSLILPQSMTMIDEMAFASCTGLKELTILATTDDRDLVEIASTESSIKIIGTHNMQTGEILDLKIEDDTIVKWTVTDGVKVVSVDQSTGKVTALSVGNATLTATSVSDPNVKTSVTFEVANPDPKITISNTAFNRCNDLEKIILNAYNPNTIKIINGTAWNFNKTCKIYVPKGAKQMYVNSELWAPYADQIIEQE